MYMLCLEMGIMTFQVELIRKKYVLWAGRTGSGQNLIFFLDEIYSTHRVDYDTCIKNTFGQFFVCLDFINVPPI